MFPSIQKNFFLAILFLISTAVSAQKTPAPVTLPSVPVDKSTNLITYSDVVDMKGATKADLFERGMRWFKGYYPNSAEKLRASDAEAGTMEGFIRFKYYYEGAKTGKSEIGLIQYSILLYFKDNKYKYEVTKFNLKDTSYKPCEPWLEKDSPSAERHAQFLQQLDDEIKKVISSLQHGMVDDGKKKKDDW